MLAHGARPSAWGRYDRAAAAATPRLLVSPARAAPSYAIARNVGRVRRVAGIAVRSPALMPPPAPRSRGQQQPRKPCWPSGRGDCHAAASPARDTHRIARRRQHVACWRRSPRRRTLPSAPASHRISHVVRLAGSARKERHTAGRDTHPAPKTARTVREGSRYCQIHGSAYRCVRYGTKGVPAETAKLWCAARMWPYWYTAQSHQRASFPARRGACTGSRRHPSGEPRQSAIRPPGGSRGAVRPAQG